MMKIRTLAATLTFCLAPLAHGGWEEAVDAYNRGDYAVAAQEFQPFAEQGQATAQYILGWIYQNGEGVPQDYAESARWYEKAAMKDNADAQYALGYYYMTGSGVAPDNAKAADWFRKAAAGTPGKAGAQYLLGYLLARGEGVPVDEAEAAAWYRKAADQGYADAQYALALALASGTGIDKDESAANDWLRRAAEQKHVEAAYLLGWNAERGVGVLPDYAEAARWYRQAADGGNPDAQYQLATLLRDGKGLAKDEAQALALFQKAAAAGQPSIPATVDEYLRAGRHEQAFALADTWLEKQPDDVQLLTVLGVSAANGARTEPGRFVGPARDYGNRAIAAIEQGTKPAGLDETQWNEYRTRWLPQLYLRLGTIAQKAGPLEEARSRFLKVTELDPSDPYAWYFLGQTHFTEYERISAASKGLEGAAKSEAVGLAFAQLDRVIEYYARAVVAAEARETLKELRDPVMRDLQGVYEFRNGSRSGLDEVLARYRK
jgi:hypothetical protein